MSVDQSDAFLVAIELDRSFFRDIIAIFVLFMMICKQKIWKVEFAINPVIWFKRAERDQGQNTWRPKLKLAVKSSKEISCNLRN